MAIAGVREGLSSSLNASDIASACCMSLSIQRQSNVYTITDQQKGRLARYNMTGLDYQHHKNLSDTQRRCIRWNFLNWPQNMERGDKPATINSDDLFDHVNELTTKYVGIASKYGIL